MSIFQQPPEMRFWAINEVNRALAAWSDMDATTPRNKSTEGTTFEFGTSADFDPQPRSLRMGI